MVGGTRAAAPGAAGRRLAARYASGGLRRWGRRKKREIGETGGCVNSAAWRRRALFMSRWLLNSRKAYPRGLSVFVSCTRRMRLIGPYCSNSRRSLLSVTSYDRRPTKSVWGKGRRREGLRQSEGPQRARGALIKEEQERHSDGPQGRGGAGAREAEAGGEESGAGASLRTQGGSTEPLRPTLYGSPSIFGSLFASPACQDIRQSEPE